MVALSLHIARDWLLAQSFSPWTLNALVLSFGAAGLCVWERVWDVPRGVGKRREVRDGDEAALVLVKLSLLLCPPRSGIIELTVLGRVRRRITAGISRSYETVCAQVSRARCGINQQHCLILPGPQICSSRIFQHFVGSWIANIIPLEHSRQESSRQERCRLHDVSDGRRGLLGRLGCI